MINKNPLGIILLVLGIVILVFFLIVDIIGIGDPGFGYRQITGVVIGIIVGGVGWLLKGKK